MVILVNGRFLIPDKLEGIGLYSFEMISHLTKSHPEHQFVICIDRQSSLSFTFGENVQMELIRPAARHPLLFIWWFEVGIPRAYRKHKADLFLSLDGFCSLHKSVHRTLLVIHDLAYIHYPEQIGLINRWYYQYFMPRYIKRADAIVTVSQSTLKDLAQQFPSSEKKASFIYNGIRPTSFKNISSNSARSNWSLLNRPYFMTLGSIHPRKNLLSVLSAFQIFKEDDHVDTYLIIVGRMAWKTGSIRNVLENHPNKEQIVLTGYLSDQEVFSLLQKSIALLYVSLFEGFGLPILEAMSLGVPVITSDRSSMQEIAHDAAMLVDPESPEDIALGMKKLATDKKLKVGLVSKGYDRIKKFDWQKAADEIWTVIDTIV